MEKKELGKSLIIDNLKNIYEDNFESNLDYNFKEININNFLEIEKLNQITNKFIFVFEINLEKIKINKKIIDNIIKENKINSEKINIIFNKTNKYSINKKIAENIFYKIKILGNIKLNNYCNFLLNKKNNYKKENKNLKIIKKI